MNLKHTLTGQGGSTQICCPRSSGTRQPTTLLLPDAYQPLNNSTRLLDGVSVAYMSAVCKQWHAAVAGDDTIWRALLHTEFRETGLCGPDGQQCVKYHEKYKLWMQEHNQYGDVARRVRWAWGKIHHALQRDLPEALETLYPGYVCACTQGYSIWQVHKTPLVCRPPHSVSHIDSQRQSWTLLRQK